MKALIICLFIILLVCINVESKLNPSLKNAVEGERKPVASFSKEEEADYTCCTGPPVTMADGKFVVTVGAYIDQFNTVDVQASTFVSNGYMWLSWNSCYTLDDGSYYRPDETIIVENIAQSWATTFTAETQTPICGVPREGYSYRAFGYNLNLAMKFEYTRYPLDRQELYLAFEDLLYDDRFVVYRPDPDSNFSNNVLLPKFKLGDMIERHRESKQKTSYGKETDNYSYSRVEIGVVIQRKLSYFFVKVMPPIFITLGTSVVAFVVDPIHAHERLFIAPGSVLSLVFLQIGFSAETPDGGSLTVIDWVFNWCYFLLFVMLLEMAIVVLIMARWELRIAKCDAGGKSTETDTLQSLKILKLRRRLSLVVDAVTLVFIVLGVWVGTTVVVLIARFAGSEL